METAAIIDIITDAAADSAVLFPFLLLTYLLLEYLERRTDGKSLNLVGKAGRWGPVAGGIAGLIPQCGLAAAAANLYAARAISVGALLAVFLTTSDEMLPIMISNAVAPEVVVKILGIKLLCGICIGLACDAALRQKALPVDVEPLCEQEDCHCEEEGILRPAMYHAVKITLFVLVFTLALNAALELWSEKFLNDIVFNRPLFGPPAAALLGMIPNCSASVAVTQLWIDGGMSNGALISGLLSGAGVGLLVLFRVNRKRRENLKIVGILYLSASVVGILVEFLQINL